MWPSDLIEGLKLPRPWIHATDGEGTYSRGDRIVELRLGDRYREAYISLNDFAGRGGRHTYARVYIRGLEEDVMLPGMPPLAKGFAVDITQPVTDQDILNNPEMFGDRLLDETTEFYTYESAREAAIQFCRDWLRGKWHVVEGNMFSPRPVPELNGYEFR